MPIARGLKRLLRVRELQEEQSRVVLRSAREERDRLRRLLAALVEQAVGGRALVQDAIRSGNSQECIIGLEEQAFALRFGWHVNEAVEAAELRLDDLRVHYLSVRAKKLQAEVLIARRQQDETRENARKDQHALDETTIARFSQKDHESQLASKA